MSKYYDLGTKITYKGETWIVRGYFHSAGGNVAVIEPLVPTTNPPIDIPLDDLTSYPKVITQQKEKETLQTKKA